MRGIGTGIHRVRYKGYRNWPFMVSSNIFLEAWQNTFYKFFHSSSVSFFHVFVLVTFSFFLKVTRGSRHIPYVSFPHSFHYFLVIHRYDVSFVGLTLLLYFDLLHSFTYHYYYSRILLLVIIILVILVSIVIPVHEC